jgi:hypothetical protein
LQTLKALNPSDEAALNSFIQDIRQAGIPLTRLGIKRMINDGSLEEILTSEIKRITKDDIEQQIEMIDIPDSCSRMMKREATVGLFKSVMKGYKITGFNADILTAILADPVNETEVLTYVSLYDARKFAKRLKELTGRKFRVQTEAEWKSVRDRLSGNKWTWTETKDQQGLVILCNPGQKNVRQVVNRLSSRYRNYAIRLVEDLPASRKENNEKTPKA